MCFAERNRTCRGRLDKADATAGVRNHALESKAVPQVVRNLGNGKACRIDGNCAGECSTQRRACEIGMILAVQQVSVAISLKAPYQSRGTRREWRTKEAGGLKLVHVDVTDIIGERGFLSGLHEFCA